MRKSVLALSEQQRCRSASRSLISTFVSRCLDSIIALVSISEISSLHLASVAAQAGLCRTWSQTPKTDFLVAWLICIGFRLHVFMVSIGNKQSEHKMCVPNPFVFTKYVNDRKDIIT